MESQANENLLAFAIVPVFGIDILHPDPTAIARFGVEPGFRSAESVCQRADL